MCYVILLNSFGVIVISFHCVVCGTVGDYIRNPIHQHPITKQPICNNCLNDSYGYNLKMKKP